VPDLRNPFLGVHFTRRPEGEVTVGPSALPLLGREQYRGLAGANVSDGLAMIAYLLRLFGRNRDHSRSIALRELAKISRSGFYREAEGLAVGFEPGDLLPGKEPGIRAQLVTQERPNCSAILSLRQGLGPHTSSTPCPRRLPRLRHLQNMWSA
jgi:(S)-2-hydroxyglutarate dehydrogenase